MTSRGGMMLRDAARDSLPWRYLVGYLVADRGGYHEWMTYLGLAPLGLGVLALWRSPRSERWFWAGLAVSSLVLSLGTNTPVYAALLGVLPGLKWLRVPPRALVLVILSANVLAATGADALFETGWPARLRRGVTLAAFAGLLVCVGVGLGFALLLRNRMPAAVLVSAAAGCGLMAVTLASARPQAPSTISQALLVVVLALDLWSTGRSLIELRPAEEVFGEGERKLFGTF